MGLRKRVTRAEQQVDRAMYSNRTVMEALNYVLLEVAHVLEEHSSSAASCCSGDGQCRVVAGLAPLAERADSMISSRLTHYDSRVTPSTPAKEAANE